MELTPAQLRMVQLVADSGLFDEAWYLQTYGAQVETGLPAIVHFLAHGRTGAFDPGPEFDCRFYLERHADVAASGVHPLLHYLRHGRQEGRTSRPSRPLPEAAMRARFDARASGGFRGSLLIVDDQVPDPQLGAGYPRALDILTVAVEAGWFVTHYPLIFATVDGARAARIVPPQVEIAAGRGIGGLADFMRARSGEYDGVLVSRPHNMALFREGLAKVPGFIDLSRVVYDAEAVFALREPPGARAGKPLEAALAAETALSDGVAAVLAVNDLEAAAFQARGSAGHVLGHALEPRPTTTAFADRRDILFVGALHQDVSPNVDSLEFFVGEVMSELDRLIGADWVLRVAGRNGSARVRALASARVQLLGQVEDVTPLYAQSRLFIAPTRYAAGIPRKVHEAAAHGLPAVVTSLLARQLGWGCGEAVLAADAAGDFARACQRLYQDAALWETLRTGGLARVAADCSPAAFAAILRDVLEPLARRR